MRRRVLNAALAAMLAGCAVPSVAGAADLRVGFSGYFDLLHLPGQDKRVIVGRMRAAGAEYVRIPVEWVSIERAEPPREAATDPRWPGYEWHALDDSVIAISEARLDPLLVVSYAPLSAETPGRRPDSLEMFPAGTWQPSPARLRAFATAVARRYAGGMRDESGRRLPRVRHYQVWNEPNLPLDFGPQFVEAAGRMQPASPDWYRSMLNQVYAGVKAVHAGNVVVTGAVAPFGDYEALQQDSRMPPVSFVRRLLCLTAAGGLPSRRCADPPRFDILAFNAYPETPFAHAAQPRDVDITDSDRLRRALRVAERAGTALPRRRHGLWLTEVSWDSVDIPSRGINHATQAQYVTKALFAAWREDIRTVLWWAFRDFPDPMSTFQGQAGVYTRGATVADDRPKPSLASYAFPFLAVRERARTRLWGLAPRAGATVQVQQSVRGSWRRLATLRSRGRVFTSTRVRVRPGRLVRARAAGRVSPAWRAP